MAAVTSALHPELATHDQSWQRLLGSAPALAIVNAANRAQQPVLVIAPDEQHAFRLEQALKFFAAGQTNLSVQHFPDQETLAYDVFSPQQDITSARLAILNDLGTRKHGILVVTAAALMQRLPPRSYLDSHVFQLNTGDTLDLNATRTRLEAAGYICVENVSEHGQFAIRGSLFDLYPMGSNTPYRIDLFDDEIDSIREFDADTQRSTTTIKRIAILPGREFPLDDGGIQHFRRHYRDAFTGNPQDSLIYRDISRGVPPGGIEYYLPLFFEQTATLFDYLPTNILCIHSGETDYAAQQNWAQIAERYEQRNVDSERPLLPPDTVFIAPDTLSTHFTKYPQIQLQKFDSEEKTTSQATQVFATSPPPLLGIDTQAPEPAQKLKAFLNEFDGRSLLVAESDGRRETLLGLLRSNQLKPEIYPDWRSFLSSDNQLGIVVAPLDQGLLLNEPKLALITEPQLFGDRVRQRRKRKPARDPQTIIRDLTDLAIGAPVVHIEHGIGRYQGLETRELGGHLGEYLILEYADSDTLYVPVQSLDLISRYTGAAPESTPLHRLGSGQWEKVRRRAAEKARDVAAELLDIHARRAAKVGISFQLDGNDYRNFASAFPFEETDDQLTTIEQVLADMQHKNPMDRVVCGDVGFGKTEVAMRAAFVAVNNGKQVAVLVPTTLLAQQHFQNFQDRFADWPVNVELLSRFRTKKQEDGVIAGLEDGTVDIVISTHKLLKSKLKFKALGLMIVDEEQRFGVRDKEQLKELRAEVDLLTLTATPIPRTLNMSLAGLRDLSIISTPPSNRMAVSTFARQWEDSLIREACTRELHRGGQIYFLHNKVENIEKIAHNLRELLPDARIQIAHGQMRERELEDIMRDFYHRRFDILVCTTIIESGIDVPNANTIIINRADNLGLAQLHQLRGRVGRSHHRAYCYLITPPESVMTADAVKRIEALTAHESIGAGFALATHDMEIRGAGELLGAEQSGQIQEVGFSLYNDLLERAVKALKSGNQPSLKHSLQTGVDVDMQLPALIPEDYVGDVHTRLILYKRIASATDTNALEELQVELIDRFGLLPEPTKTLFAVSEIKQQAERIGITKIQAHSHGARIVFCEKPSIDPMKIIELIQREPQTYSFNGQDTLRLNHDLPDDQRLQTLHELLNTLGSPN